MNASWFSWVCIAIGFGVGFLVLGFSTPGILVGLGIGLVLFLAMPKKLPGD